MDVQAYLMEIGYSEAEASAMAADEKYTKPIAAALAKYEEGNTARTVAEQAQAEQARQKAELDKWWKETAQPAILNADGGSAAAKAEAAQYKAYIQELKDKGYPVPDNWLSAPANPNPSPSPTPAPSFDPQKAAVEMAQATARLYDLGAEYQELYGTPMPNAYGLLEEARQSNKPLTDHVRAKFNFDGKRKEIADKKESDRVAAITKDITEKLEAKYAQRSNPMLAPAVTSRAAAVAEQNKDHADSWKTKAGREQAKKDRLLEFRQIASKTA